MIYIRKKDRGGDVKNVGKTIVRHLCTAPIIASRAKIDSID